MRSIWNGTISFGLVSIPVKLYPGTKRKDVRFSLLHADCHSKLKYRRWCPKCQREVDYRDTVRGYEYEKDHFVVITDDEYEQIAKKQKRRIDLASFVDLGQIDPVYYDRTYYVLPSEAGRKPYVLLTQAMEETERAGIGRFLLRSKPHLVALRTKGQVLLLQTMYYADEVRDLEIVEREVGTPLGSEDTEIDPREREMAVQLIEGLSTPFEPEAYRNDYRDALLEFIERKIQGKETVFSAEEDRREVIDLMDALEESLEKVQRRAP